MLKFDCVWLTNVSGIQLRGQGKMTGRQFRDILVAMDIFETDVKPGWLVLSIMWNCPLTEDMGPISNGLTLRTDAYHPNPSRGCQSFRKGELWATYQHVCISNVAALSRTIAQSF